MRPVLLSMDCFFRYIDRDALAKWAGSAEASAAKFDKYSIYYDDEKSEMYDVAPNEEQRYQACSV